MATLYLLSKVSFFLSTRRAPDVVQISSGHQPVKKWIPMLIFNICMNRWSLKIFKIVTIQHLRAWQLKLRGKSSLNCITAPLINACKILSLFWLFTSDFCCYFVRNYHSCEDSHVGLALHEQHLKRYFHIIDNQDPVKGINNFSKGALALSNSFKNGTSIKYSLRNTATRLYFISAPVESKQWSLKDLRASAEFQQFENDLKKENTRNSLNLDLEKTLDYVTKLESKVKESKPGPSSFETSRPLPNNLSSKTQHRLPEKKTEAPRPNATIFRSSKEQPVCVYTQKTFQENNSPFFTDCGSQISREKERKRRTGKSECFPDC